jgi:hypothetical protein
VLGAELVKLDKGRWAYRFGDRQLNVHGPGATPEPRAANPVRPGNSDLCFVYDGSADEALAHLERHGVAVELARPSASARAAAARVSTSAIRTGRCSS